MIQTPNGLDNYIRQSMAQGYAPAQIAAGLRAQGYSDQQISSAMAAARGGAPGMRPAPMAAEESPGLFGSITGVLFRPKETLPAVLAASQLGTLLPYQLVLTGIGFVIVTLLIALLGQMVLGMFLGPFAAFLGGNMFLFGLKIGFYYLLYVNITIIIMAALVFVLLKYAFKADTNFFESWGIYLYPMTPAFVSVLFFLIPFLGWLIMMAASIYTIYLQYVALNTYKQLSPGQTWGMILLLMFLPSAFGFFLIF